MNTTTTKRTMARKVNTRTTNRRVEVELDHMTYGGGTDPCDVATIGTPHVTLRLFDAEGTDATGETRRLFGGASFHNVEDLAVEARDLTTTKVLRLTFSTTNSRGEVTGRYDVSLFGLDLSDLNDAVVAALLRSAVTA